ncbi:MAG: GMC family oxidoreductase [Candidatus Binatia bacterium]
MARGRKRTDDVFGNRALARFDCCVIGSGAGGGTAAGVLAAAGKKVLVLEAGHNPYPDVDRPGPMRPTLHGSDELKDERYWMETIPDLEPRTFRTSASDTAAIHRDVNLLPKMVGGAWSHADCKAPRFTPVDFRMVSALNEARSRFPSLVVPGFFDDAPSANWADWPLTYADLEPYYGEVERLYGVAGDDGNPFAPPRSTPWRMPPNEDMYVSVLLRDGCAATTFLGEALHPHKYPAAIATRFYSPDGTPELERPPCNACGWCSGFGCPSHAKGHAGVSTLRAALLSGNCQLRVNCHASRLVNDGGHVHAIEYVDGEGTLQTAVADAYLLAASAIESARLCLLSATPGGGALGNSSGQLGQNLMFHFQTNVNGFLPRRVHGQRGQAVTSGFSDFRGVEFGGDRVRVADVGSGPQVFMGGIIEFSAPQGLPVSEDGDVYAFDLPTMGLGLPLKRVLRDMPLGQHLFGLLMQAEDAPQRSNTVDLDPSARDIFGLPVPRVTYRNHPFELEARKFYVPFMKQVVLGAGATQVFVTPCDATFGDPPTSRHVLGTLRMGASPATSVTNADGRFHDVDNLYAVDGAVFPTSGGWNPTLTLMAVAARTAHRIAGTSPQP